MTFRNWDLSNSNTQTRSMLKNITIQSRIERFLDRKFRASRSYSTKSTYRTALNQFEIFCKQDYQTELDQLIEELVTAKSLDPLEVLDDFYTYLTKAKRQNSERVGFANGTIRLYVITCKEFLNDAGCRIYSEDIKRKFKLPKRTWTFEEGLTKDSINQILRLANYKLSTIILLACSSGMRIGEIAQLKLSDIDFTKKPTTIKIRAETTKTRETRITHISSETTKALKDLLAKADPIKENNDYLFLTDYAKRIEKLTKNAKKNNGTWKERFEGYLKNLSKEDLYAINVRKTKHNYETQLITVINNIPELSKRNENGRYQIHFHAFRYFFKTQVTDAHQSDFAEALMGHKSLKLVYYKQNAKTREKTYLGIEHAVTISENEQIDKNYNELQETNQEMRTEMDSLSKALRTLERRIEEPNPQN